MKAETTYSPDNLIMLWIHTRLVLAAQYPKCWASFNSLHCTYSMDAQDVSLTAYGNNCPPL